MHPEIRHHSRPQVKAGKWLLQAAALSPPFPQLCAPSPGVL